MSAQIQARFKTLDSHLIKLLYINFVDSPMQADLSVFDQKILSYIKILNLESPEKFQRLKEVIVGLVDANFNRKAAGKSHYKDIRLTSFLR